LISVGVTPGVSAAIAGAESASNSATDASLIFPDIDFLPFLQTQTSACDMCPACT
jgi:hypothetical protein